MAYREDDDKESEGGDLLEGSASEVTDESEEDEVGPLGTGIDEDEKAWE